MGAFKMVWLGLVAALTLILGGCVAVPVGDGWYDYYEPVPYGGPVYGYEYLNADGVTVVYDSSPGYYVVQGYPGVYWWNDHYYRVRDGRWERSKRHRGPWESTHFDSRSGRHRPVYSPAPDSHNRRRPDDRDHARRSEQQQWIPPQGQSPLEDRRDWRERAKKDMHRDASPQPNWNRKQESFTGGRRVSDGTRDRSSRWSGREDASRQRKVPRQADSPQAPHRDLMLPLPEGRGTESD